MLEFFQTLVETEQVFSISFLKFSYNNSLSLTISVISPAGFALSHNSFKVMLTNGFTTITKGKLLHELSYG